MLPVGIDLAIKRRLDICNSRDGECILIVGLSWNGCYLGTGW